MLPRACLRSRRAFRRSHAIVNCSVVALIDDRTEQRQQRRNSHIVTEAAGCQSSAPRPNVFKWRGLAALDSASCARDVLRSLRDAQRIERAARAGLFADASDVFREPHQRAGLLDTERRLDRGNGLARPQHRAPCDRLLQDRCIDDVARRKPGPLCQPLAQASDLAGSLTMLRPARTGPTPPTDT